MYYNPENEPNMQTETAPFESQTQQNTAPSQPEKPKKDWSGKKIVALALCCALIGGATGVGSTFLGNYLLESSNTSVVYEGERETSVINVAKLDTSEKMTPAEVYAENVNSTVGITTSITTNFWGYQTTSAASGSGFILTDDGYILTNYHVIESSSTITVSTYDGTSYDATLIGYDEGNDIAVLKVEAEGLTPVVLGDSDNLNVGDDVLAIGNPLGELTFSLTSGAVSALNREVTMSNGVTMDLIQTDCAINSGNSGGALFNLYGEVIGITNAKYSSSGSEASIDNIGFAIPINHVRDIVESIIENGYLSKPYIGVSVEDVSEESQSYGLPKGAAIRSIAQDSPAQKAGLQESDIITKANDTEISSSGDLVEIVSAAAVGDVLHLTVYRQGETLSIDVTVGEQVQSALAKEESQEQSQGQQSNQQNNQPFSPWSFNFGY